MALLTIRPFKFPPCEPFSVKLSTWRNAFTSLPTIFMQIALLDDQQPQAGRIQLSLHHRGHQTAIWTNAPDLLGALRREPCDLLILNWQVADANTVLAWVRTHLAAELPVLCITTLSAAEEAGQAMTGVAFDYQLQPLRYAELSARVAVLLHRAYPQQETSPPEEYGPFSLAPETGLLQRNGVLIAVTQKEFALAHLFLRQLGRPLSRAFILESVWARETDLPTRTIDTHISRIRTKLQLLPEQGFRLHPVYGFGYRLEQLSAT